MIETVILDIDGVMTDGTKAYDLNADVISKKFCDRDFTAIKKMQSENIRVILLSRDRRVNEKMAEKRKIEYIHSKDKLETFKTLNINPETCVYVGDDYYDIPLLEYVLFSACPSDSPDDVKDISKWILLKKGGENVVMYLYEKYIKGVNL
jgi:3-deoxy-D-manno-octulosonate 8-phosphate phosphatase (KDO 8-P phosphatase)